MCLKPSLAMIGYPSHLSKA